MTLSVLSDSSQPPLLVLNDDSGEQNDHSVERGRVVRFVFESGTEQMDG